MAERTRLAKELRKAGDRAGAAELAKLPKPTPPAWALNHFAREQPEAMGAWLDVAAALRDESAAPGSGPARGDGGAPRRHRAARQGRPRSRAAERPPRCPSRWSSASARCCSRALTDAEQAERLRAGRITEGDAADAELPEPEPEAKGRAAERRAEREPRTPSARRSARPSAAPSSRRGSRRRATAHERLAAEAEERAGGRRGGGRAARGGAAHAAPQRVRGRGGGGGRARRARAAAEDAERELETLTAQLRGRAARRVPGMTYVPAPDRYDTMPYRRCGRSGLQLPAVSLGLWHNFGDDQPLDDQRAIVRRAFDLGITHFDLANNYGPPPGSAEENFGRILATDLAGTATSWSSPRRPATTCGPGPYGEWGSRKYLLASLDQSLARMGLDYVDIFYSHRFDPTRRSRRRSARSTTRCARARRCTPGSPPTRPSARARRPRSCARSARRVLIHQPSYSMLNRWIEPELLDALGDEGDRHDRVLPDRPGDADRQVPRRRPGGLARGAGPLPQARLPHRREPRARARAERDRAAAAGRRSRRWRSPGRCATRASPRR